MSTIQNEVSGGEIKPFLERLYVAPLRVANEETITQEFQEMEVIHDDIKFGFLAVDQNYDNPRCGA